MEKSANNKDNPLISRLSLMHACDFIWFIYPLIIHSGQQYGLLNVQQIPFDIGYKL